MTTRKKEDSELSPAELQREIARLRAIKRDILARDTRVKLAKVKKEHARLAERAGRQLPVTARPIVLVSDVREREARTAREAARERAELAETRVTLLRERVISGDTSAPTIASLARADTEARDAQIALARTEASANACAPGAPSDVSVDATTRAEILRKYCGYR